MKYTIITEIYDKMNNRRMDNISCTLLYLPQSVCARIAKKLVRKQINFIIKLH